MPVNPPASALLAGLPLALPRLHRIIQKLLSPDFLRVFLPVGGVFEGLVAFDRLPLPGLVEAVAFPMTGFTLAIEAIGFTAVGFELGEGFPAVAFGTAFHGGCY